MRKYVWLSLLLVLAVTTSCINTKKMVMLEDMKENVSYPMEKQPEIKIQRDDRLSIMISSRNRELAIPFNISGESFQVTSLGEVADLSDNTRKERGYVVNPNGEIELPVLGKIYVAGSTREELADIIKKRLIDENLISDPLVMIEILNLKISMMGELAHVGVITVTDGRITLLEAISRAGGLTANSSLKKVAVIREEGNERKVYMHDIRSSETLSSPCYYLQQNDIVYVHPLYVQTDIREDRTLRFYSLGIGLISFLASMAVLLK